METINLEFLNSKDPHQLATLADEFSKKTLDDKLQALKIYKFIIETNKIPNIYKHPYSWNRGIINHKIFGLEKLFHWNEYFNSQSGQDKFINNFFFRGKEKGFFVEIGAYDGLTGSNCFFFEKHLGWNGIAIEPSSNQFSKLEKNRNCNCINKALSTKIEQKEFIDVVQGYTQMSGLNNSSYKKTLDKITKDFRTKIERKNIETTTFSKAVNQNYLIDYLSIDVEGGEQDILDSIDFNLYKIKVISIENNNPPDTEYNSYLSNKGFKYIDNVGVDEIYVNKSFFGDIV